MGQDTSQVTRAGIDLGTTYSEVCIVENNKTIVVQNSLGKEMTPSVVSFLPGGVFVVGEEAKELQKGGSGLNAATFKSSMGSNKTIVSFEGKDYTAKDLSTILLKHLISEAEGTLGCKLKEVVITVPAYFDDFQRTATKEAGEACGVKVLRIINEPTAAAINYGYRQSADKTVMVYDLGGGTFDITVIRIHDGIIDVVGTTGNHNLGGKDWDKEIMDFICENFKNEFDVDPREDQSTRDELIVAAENYKKTLSQAKSVKTSVTYNGNRGEYLLTREEFESRTRHLLDQTGVICKKLMSDLKLEWSNITEILLCGGSTKMKAVPRYLNELTGRKVIENEDTNLSVAKGAAIFCSTMSTATGVSERINDVTAHSLGALSSRRDGSGYWNEVMIARNSKIPAENTKKFELLKGNKSTSIEVYALQGESEKPTDCRVLSKNVVTGFENTGDGVVIDVKYAYDFNGIVQVSAFQGEKALNVEVLPAPADTEWMGGRSDVVEDKSDVRKNIAICLDLSRSMEKENRFDLAKTALADFVHNFQNSGNTEMCLIVFADRLKAVTPLTDDFDEILNSVEGLRTKMVGRGTDASPISFAQQKIYSDEAESIIVILTDGLWGHRDVAKEEAERCRNAGVRLYAIGIGEAEEGFLAEIATTSSDSMYTELDNLGQSFTKIATAIKDGN